MKNNTYQIAVILSAVAALNLVSGCVPVVATGATTVAVTAAEERSMGDALDDTTIKAKLLGNYANKDFDRLFVGLDVSVNEGRVLLTGKVVKPETALDAVKMAWSVAGVKEVINEIQVTDRSGIKDFSKDAYIKSKIRGQFLLDKDIRSVNYTVEVENQVVYLFGIAQDQRELDKTANIAANTPYVQKVVSHVRLKRDPLRTKQ